MPQHETSASCSLAAITLAITLIVIILVYSRMVSGPHLDLDLLRFDAKGLCKSRLGDLNAETCWTKFRRLIQTSLEARGMVI
jgi:hypothetical protein